jgi:hypothetical protein
VPLLDSEAPLIEPDKIGLVWPEDVDFIDFYACIVDPPIYKFSIDRNGNKFWRTGETK